MTPNSQKEMSKGNYHKSLLNHSQNNHSVNSRGINCMFQTVVWRDLTPSALGTHLCCLTPVSVVTLHQPFPVPLHNCLLFSCVFSPGRLKQQRNSSREGTGTDLTAWWSSTRKNWWVTVTKTLASKETSGFIANTVHVCTALYICILVCVREKLCWNLTSLRLDI